MCGEFGKISCAPKKCQVCDSESLPVHEDPDACCTICSKNWLTADRSLLVVPYGNSVLLTCSSLVYIPVENLLWYYSTDEKSWDAIDNSNSLSFTIASVYEDAFYKCTATKKGRRAEVVIYVDAMGQADDETSSLGANVNSFAF